MPFRRDRIIIIIFMLAPEEFNLITIYLPDFISNCIILLSHILSNN